MAKPPTYDHLKSRKKPVTKTCWIALDSEIADAATEASSNLKALEMRHRARPDDVSIFNELKKAIEEDKKAQKELRENSVRFVFRGIGRKRYEKIINANPPTEKQIEDVKKEDPNAELAWNPETFVPALVAEALVEPELTVEQINEMFDSEDWNPAELSALYMAAYEANNNRRVVDLGNASRGTQTSK